MKYTSPIYIKFSKAKSFTSETIDDKMIICYDKNKKIVEVEITNYCTVNIDGALKPVDKYDQNGEKL